MPQACTLSADQERFVVEYAERRRRASEPIG
jgi:hypothetical protein